MLFLSQLFSGGLFSKLELSYQNVFFGHFNCHYYRWMIRRVSCSSIAWLDSNSVSLNCTVVINPWISTLRCRKISIVTVCWIKIPPIPIQFQVAHTCERESPYSYQSFLLSLQTILFIFHLWNVIILIRNKDGWPSSMSWFIG